MTAEIVNLRRHRKRKTRTGKDEEAAANRAKFGRAKNEREVTQAKRAQDGKRLDDHKIEN
jgi:hypothetical protein